MDDAHARAQAQHAADVAALQIFSPVLAPPPAVASLPAATMLNGGGLPVVDASLVASAAAAAPLADPAFSTPGAPLTLGQQTSGSEDWKRTIGSRTGNYKCSRCGQPKKNHTCNQPAKEKGNKEAKNHGWRRREDMIIQAGVDEHGFKWSAIATGLPGRTDNAVRNRWHRMERARKFREELQNAPDEDDVSVGGASAAALPTDAAVSTVLVSTGGVAPSRQTGGKGAGGKPGGYRCSKCGQPKKGHLCPAMNDAPPQPGEIAAAAAAGANGGAIIGGELAVGVAGVVGVDVAAPPPSLPSMGAMPGLAGMAEAEAAAAAAADLAAANAHLASAAAAAAAVAAAGGGGAAGGGAAGGGAPADSNEMVVMVGNRVVSASEGDAVEYLTTFGYGAGAGGDKWASLLDGNAGSRSVPQMPQPSGLPMPQADAMPGMFATMGAAPS